MTRFPFLSIVFLTIVYLFLRFLCLCMYQRIESPYLQLCLFHPWFIALKIMYRISKGRKLLIFRSESVKINTFDTVLCQNWHFWHYQAQWTPHLQRRLVSKVSISTRNCVKSVNFDTLSTILATGSTESGCKSCNMEEISDAEFRKHSHHQQSFILYECDLWRQR